MSYLKRKILAFTLLELLITASLIGIFISGFYIYANRFFKKSRDEKRKADLQRLATALERYRADKGKYPTATNCEALKTQLLSYLSKFPTDPLDPTYKYYCSASDKNFTLGAYLELGSGSTSYSCGSKNCNFTLSQ